MQSPGQGSGPWARPQQTIPTQKGEFLNILMSLPSDGLAFKVQSTQVLWVGGMIHKGHVVTSQTRNTQAACRAGAV